MPGSDERMAVIEKRLDRMAERLRALEDTRDDSGGADADDVARLTRSLNGLRREHRDLKDTVEDEILAYLDDERDVLTRLQQRVQEYGEIMREIKRNRDHLGEVDDELERLDHALQGTVDAATFEERAEELSGAIEEVRDRARDRMNKLEARLDFLTADDEE